MDLVEDRTLGQTISYGYDRLGNRERMSLDSGETVLYRWDALGRLSEVTDPEGAVTRFGYDAAGRRSRASYGNGTNASWSHDPAGQVRAIVYSGPGGEVLTAFGYEYDPAGNRRHKELADGTRETYGYDGLDRLTRVEYPSGRRVEYGYDGVGNRLSMVDTGKAPVVRWAVTAAASSENPFFGKAANATGQPDVSGCERGSMRVWQPNRMPQTASAAPQWLEVGFARAERAVGVKVREVDAAPFAMRVDLVEEDGTAHTVYQGGDTTKCGEWLSLSFPPTPYRVKKARIWVAASAGAWTAEGVDAVGLVAAPLDDYQYNGFNQLDSVLGNDGSSTSFGYDLNGNQVSKAELRPGQAAQATSYVYDHDNRLVGIALPSGVANAFEYDANGLRVKKTDSYGTSSFLLDGLSIIGQYAPDGSRQAWYTQSLARIDEVLNVVNASGKFWYQADARGSVYALTTSTGSVQARGGYDVFGEDQ